MNRRKPLQKALIAAVIALILAAGALWYSRPMDIYGLSPSLQEPDMIFVSLEQFNGSPSENQSRHDTFTPEDPAWDTVLGQLESLRFYRPPWNFPLQFLNERLVSGRQTHEGDWLLMFHVVNQEKGSIVVQFFIDEWVYTSPYSDRNLTLWTEGGEKTGNTLSEILWPLLKER